MSRAPQVTGRRTCPIGTVEPLVIPEKGLVTQAEDDVAAQEARALEEVGWRVAMAHLNLEHEFDEKLGLIQAEAEGRTAALRAKLEEAT